MPFQEQTRFDHVTCLITSTADDVPSPRSLSVDIIEQHVGKPILEALQRGSIFLSEVMKTVVGLVYLLACLLEPFKVVKQLNLSHEAQISLCDEKVVLKGLKPWEFLPAGHKIGTLVPLVRELMRKLSSIEKNMLGVKLIGL